MRRRRVQRDLIYDIGANEGQDSAFYLAKGFRVVAVEANPVLVKHLQDRFADDLAAGRLNLVDRAVTDAAGPLQFYVNTENTHWSSLHRDWGTRDGASTATTITVDTVRLGDMLAVYGCPYYLKIDVEGEDMALLHALARTSHRPAYVSVEEHGVEAIDLLDSLGYDRFALVNQQQLYLVSNPNPPREGRFVDVPHSGAAGQFMTQIPHAWFDIHARHRGGWVRRPFGPGRRFDVARYPSAGGPHEVPGSRSSGRSWRWRRRRNGERDPGCRS
jgi:FkbM family methyltransferase